MKLSGEHITNCTMEVTDYGKREVVITSLGYGFVVGGAVGEARRKRTFYPQKVTPGLFYIEAAFTDVKQRNDLHDWLATYFMRITNQWAPKTLGAMTLTVPSRGFMHIGYPTSSLAYGDSVGVGIYKSVIQFTSAVNALGNTASRYTPPTRDDEALKFYLPADEWHMLPSPMTPRVIAAFYNWRS